VRGYVIAKDGAIFEGDWVEEDGYIGK